MVGESAYLYCPRCGSEYYPVKRLCADCAVALVSRAEYDSLRRGGPTAGRGVSGSQATRSGIRGGEASPAAGEMASDEPAAGAASGHGVPKQVGIDIQTLSRDQSAMFQRRLASAGVRFTMRGTTVRVALGDADDARDLLAELALPDPAEEGQHYDVNPFQRESIEGVGVPAARMRRWVGAVIDGFVFGVLAIGLEAAGVRPSVTLGLAGAITVVMVTLIGATPGKLAVGTRVCDIRTWRTPSLWASAVRWVTPLAAGLLIPIVPWGVQLMFLGYLANVILILFAADGRGLHDLAAGTIVISPSRGVDRRRRR